MAYGTLNADVIANSNGLTGNAIGPGFKNRIINGRMEIDQRNAGAAVTVNGSANYYGVDRWYGIGQSSDGVFTIQRDTTAPSGFINSLKVTVTTADASIGATQVYRVSQAIEGLNVTDFGWGTASAATVTLSFWVRSSLTGTFGGNLLNSAISRAYPFTFTISSANTWEKKSVTIAGDTTGTWLTTNGIGVTVSFVIGMGATYTGTPNAWNAGVYFAPTGNTNIISTLNATFYITGVQLELGETATSFDARPFGTELQLCQRYCYVMDTNNRYIAGNGYFDTTTAVKGVFMPFPVSMRGNPSITFNGTTASYVVQRPGSSAATCSAVGSANIRTDSFEMTATSAASSTAGYATAINLSSDASIVASAEL